MTIKAIQQQTVVVVFMFAVLLLAYPYETRAAQGDQAGTVIMVKGEVVAEAAEGEIRPLQRRSAVYVNDTLITRVGARAQIRFTDGSLVALAPDSVFHIEQYHFAGKEDGTESAAFRLLKGGMRSITGAIGKTNKKNYKVITSVANIGIRGTDYKILLIDGNSINDTRLQGGVNDGAIVVSNRAGSFRFDKEQYFEIQGLASPARTLLAPPPALQEQFSLRDVEPRPREERASEETSVGDTALAAQDISGDSVTDTTAIDIADAALTADAGADITADIAPTEQQNLLNTMEDSTIAVAGQPTPDKSLVGVGFVSYDPVDGYEGNGGLLYNDADYRPDDTIVVNLDTVDGVDNVPVSATVYFDPDPAATGDPGCMPCTFSTGTATLAEHGGDAALGVNWGRWQGEFQLTENGITTQTEGNFHYIYSPNLTPLSTVTSLKGTFSYSMVGGTAPVDQDGTTGVLTEASMSVDFTSQTISSASLKLTMPGYSDSIIAQSSGDDSITDVVKNGHSIGLEDTNNKWIGSMEIGFVGPGAEGAISAYQFQSTGTAPSDSAISGVVLMQQQ